MTTQVTAARRETGEAAALVSRVSRPRRLRARALPSLNLKKNRDCSQSKENITKYSTTHKSLVMM